MSAQPPREASPSQQAPESAPAATEPAAPAPPPPGKEYYITKVEVTGADGDDLRAAQHAVWLRANSTTTKSEIVAVRNNLVNVGLFGWVEPVAHPYQNGTAIEFQVRPNAPQRSVKVTGASQLPEGFVDEMLSPLQNRTANINAYLAAKEHINDWYRENDVFAVVDENQDHLARSMATGALEFQVNELGVRRVETRFVDNEGEGVKAKTHPQRVQRYINLRPGDVLDIKRVTADIQSLNSLNIFDRISGRPLMSESQTTTAEDGSSTGRSGSVMVQTLRGKDGEAPYIAREGLQKGDLVDWEYLLTEKAKFGEFKCSGGATMEAGHGFQPVGVLSYTNNNVAGTLCRLGASIQLYNLHDRNIDVSWTDPWLLSSSPERRLSQVVRAYSTRRPEDAIFGVVRDDGGIQRRGEDEDEERRRPCVNVQRSGLTVERGALFGRRCAGTIGVTLERSRCLDGEGNMTLVDPYQWPLAHSATGVDKALSVTGSIQRTGSHTSARGSLTQAICPPGRNRDRGPWLMFTRFQGHAIAETRSFKDTTARLTAAGGVQLGDLPAYDAHVLGGVNCVRGYDEGAMGTARHWAQLGGELESPPFRGRFSGVAFVDVGSDLNSGQTVVGDPAGTRGKPGKGCGYGVGLRMTSPMGPLRLDYAWCDRSKWREEGRTTLLRGRLHIGIGTRF